MKNSYCPATHGYEASVHCMINDGDYLVFPFHHNCIFIHPLFHIPSPTTGQGLGTGWRVEKRQVGRKFSVNFKSNCTSNPKWVNSVCAGQTDAESTARPLLVVSLDFKTQKMVCCCSFLCSCVCGRVWNEAMLLCGGMDGLNGLNGLDAFNGDGWRRPSHKTTDSGQMLAF